MANLEVLALDTAVPQIRAPGAGDGYSVPRDMTVASGANLTLSGGTANGVLYLNGSKVATSGSGLQFDGTRLFVGTTTTSTSSTQSGEVYSTGLVGFMLTNTTAANFPISIKNEGSSGTRNLIRFYEGSAGGTARASISLDGSNYLTFDTSNFIINTGNLGIGATSPDERLTVTATNPTDGRVASLRNNATSSLTGTKLWFNQATVDNWNIGQPAGVNAFVFCNSTGSANERMRLDSSGNLGLGVTPSAWSSSYKALQVGATASMFGGASGEAAYIQSNAFASATGYKYITTAAATQYGQSGGAHSWSTAASGTAGNAITFTQAMTLDASGRLLVGTTTNNAGEALQVDANGVGASIYTAIFRNTSTSTSVYNAVRFNQGASGSATGYIGTGGSAVSNNAFANNFVVGTQSNSALVFNTNDTERARITSGGDFWVGTTTAISPGGLTAHNVLSGGTSSQWAAAIRNSTATTPWGLVVQYSAAAPNDTSSTFLYCLDSGPTLRASIRSNGGLANYQANNVDLSDARTKNSITPAASMWDKVAALEIVAYKYNDQTHDDVNLGVIAQQVESVEPVWVDTDGFGETPEDGVPLKTVYTKDITFAAIKALQEAMARIEQLEAKVAALEA